MKKKINAIVFFLTGVCVIISIKLSAVPLWPVFTEDSFWYTSAVDRERLSLVYDICVGFLLSAIFYFLVDVLPEKTRAHRGKVLVRNYVNSLLEQMEKIISICFQVYGIETHSNIYLKDLNILCGNTSHADEDISFRITTYLSSGKRKTGVHTAGKFNNVIKSCITEIEKDLQNINRFSFFYASCEEFLEVLTRIESCKLISHYRNNTEKSIACFRYGDADTAFYDFYLLYHRLRKMQFHTEYTCTELDSAEVCATYKEKRESGELLDKAFAYQQQRISAYAQERPVLLYGGTHNSDNIILRIQKAVPYLSACRSDTVDSLMLQQSQLIIVLDNITIPLNSIDPKQKIFRFSGRLIPGCLLRVINWKNSQKQIYYKRPLSLLGITFNAEHPTKQDISKLTNMIDEYIREKYSLNLDIF